MDLLLLPRLRHPCVDCSPGNLDPESDKNCRAYALWVVMNVPIQQQLSEMKREFFYSSSLRLVAFLISARQCSSRF
jgi:hypothetical protein